MTNLPGITTTIKERGLGRLGAVSDRLVLIGAVPTNARVEKMKLVPINDDEGLAKLGSSDLRKAATRALRTGLRGVDVIAVDKDASSTDAISYEAAIDLALAESKAIEVLSIVDATDASVWSSFAERLSTAAGNHQYTLGVVRPRLPGESETVNTWAEKLTDIKTDSKPNGERGNARSIRLAKVAGDLVLAGASPDDNTEPALFSYLPLVLARRAHEAVDAVKYGPIPLAADRSPKLNDDQLKTLSDNGYTVCREYYGTDGIYITLARIDSDDNSDFDTVEKTRIMNRACRLVRAAQLQFVNDTIVVSTEGLEMFKAMCALPLSQMQANGEITNFSVELNDIEQILSTNTIRARIRIVPLGKLSYIENEISFSTQEAI